MRIVHTLGRLAGVAAVMYGAAMSLNIAGSDDLWPSAMFSAIGVAIAAGGYLYLTGLDREPLHQGRMAAGWMIFTLGFLLPTSFTVPLLVLSLAAVPSFVVGREPAHVT